MSNNTLKSFKSILNVTGSQCKDLRTGVICSDLLFLVRILAAAFWMSCSCLMLGTPQDIRADFGPISPLLTILGNVPIILVVLKIILSDFPVV